MRSRRIVTTVLVCLAVLLLLPAAALAWSNGDHGGNGFGTHDWILREATRLAAERNAGWVILRVAEPKTDDPDTVFHDTYYHVYDVWGSSTYGDAPKKIMAYYAKALTARKAGDWIAASKYAGLMAHYYGDICNPLHTDQTSAEDRMHSSYEEAAQEYTDGKGENSAWVTFDGYEARTDVVAFAKATASTSHKSYTALVKGYNRGGMSATVLSITRKALNRAANGLADLLISIKNKVPGK
jgi:hypothetical protein